MTKVVVLGAGLGGTLMAYELKAELGKGDTLAVIGQGPRYHFVPSNPWVAAGWRERDEVEIPEQPIRSDLKPAVADAVASCPKAALRLSDD